MSTPQTFRLGRHLIALALTAPATTAVAIAIVLPFMPDVGRTPGITQIAGLMFFFGSLVGYCVELAAFVPLYALIHRRLPVSFWSMTAIGASAGALAALIVNARLWNFGADPIEIVLSPPGLAMLGALGGAIYWLFLRDASPRGAPFNGFSGSQP